MFGFLKGFRASLDIAAHTKNEDVAEIITIKGFYRINDDNLDNEPVVITNGLKKITPDMVKLPNRTNQIRVVVKNEVAENNTVDQRLQLATNTTLSSVNVRVNNEKETRFLKKGDKEKKKDEKNRNQLEEKEEKSNKKLEDKEQKKEEKLNKKLEDKEKKKDEKSKKKLEDKEKKKDEKLTKKLEDKEKKQDSKVNQKLDKIKKKSDTKDKKQERESANVKSKKQDAEIIVTAPKNKRLNPLAVPEIPPPLPKTPPPDKIVYDQIGSLDSAPPPYEEKIQMASDIDPSGNVSFGSTINDSWSFINQHRQAVKRPQMEQNKAIQSRASRIEYKVGAFEINHNSEKSEA